MVAHFNVTTHPTARSVGQQIVEAFPFETAPTYLIHDRDSVFGAEFKQRVRNMGIREILKAFRSPWQNGKCKRLIGSIRRECLDHVIVLNEEHLRQVLIEHMAYYHSVRTHPSLKRNEPYPRQVESRGIQVVADSYLGGLHHRAA